MKNFFNLTVLFSLMYLFVSETSFSQNSKFISISIDPKMISVGPYSDSKKGELDFLIRAGVIKDCHNEYGAYFEMFPNIKYRGYGAFYNYKLVVKCFPKGYKRWEFTIGPELGFIQRSIVGNTLNLSTAVNGGISYFFNRNFGFLITSNIRFRSDLKEIYGERDVIKYNGYAGLIYSW